MPYGDVAWSSHAPRLITFSLRGLSKARERSLKAMLTMICQLWPLHRERVY
jgi:hypothetical protein